MNSLSRRCFRLSFTILNNSSFHLRPLYPTLIKSVRLCSRHFDFQNVPESQFDDFEDSYPGHKLFENIDFDGIVGDDLEMKKKLQVLILELSMKLRTETLLAPKQLTSKHWRRLLDLKTDKSRETFLKNLYIREKRRETYEMIARNQREEIEFLSEKKLHGPLSTSSPMDYCLQGTTLFYRIYQRSYQQQSNFNLALAMMFGEDLVIDCSYEDFMTPDGINSCGRHITYLYSNNRLSNNPFNLILCNLDKNGRLMKVLSNYFAKMDEDNNYFITLTEKHYLDLYPAEKLIYMTPHCFNDMEKYEEDCVYILGNFILPENSNSLIVLLLFTTLKFILRSIC